MTDLYSIRRARATDLPSIYAGELDYIRQIEPEQEVRWSGGLYWHIKQWTSNLERMFIAECDGEASGTASGRHMATPRYSRRFTSRVQGAVPDSVGDSWASS